MKNHSKYSQQPPSRSKLFHLTHVANLNFHPAAICNNSSNG